MRKRIVLLLAMGMFALGYVAGHYHLAQRATSTAHAYQGYEITRLPCPVSVTGVECYKQEYHKYAYLTIAGVELKTYPAARVVSGNKIKVPWK